MSLTDQRSIRPNRIPFGNAPRLMRPSRVLLPMPNVFMSCVLFTYAPSVAALFVMVYLSFLVSNVADWLPAVIEYVVTQRLSTHTRV